MDYLTSLASTLQFPQLSGVLGRVAGVLLEPLPGSGERFCVALVAETSDHKFDASIAVNPRIARALVGNDLTSSLFNFGQLAAADFKVTAQKNGTSKNWVPPFSGMFLTEWREVQGVDISDLLNQASLIFSTLAHTNTITPPPLMYGPQPSAGEEDLFRQGVRSIVAGKNSRLDQFFEKELSVSGAGQATFRIDYLSPAVTACFTAINPATPPKYLLGRAQAALWKIATARDATLFRPEAARLITWLPEPGLPIYSERDYGVAKEVEEELRYEAKKMNIDVVAKYQASQAADYLVNLEQEIIS